VLLVTGGVSAGEYDLVRETLVATGMEVLFHGVAVRPGKPVLAGRRGGCLVVGLPGNPVSAFTMFAVLVAPLLRAMEGASSPSAPELRVRLSEPLARRPGRLTYQLAELTTHDGRFIGRAVRGMGSGDVVSLARANGFLIVPSGEQTIPAGEELAGLLWRDL
jgi:molybdopterin molybdotransferase